MSTTLQDNDEKCLEAQFDTSPTLIETQNTPVNNSNGIIEEILQHRASPEERAAAIAVAAKDDPGPPLASPRFAYFIFTVIVTCFCSGDNGFDGTIMGAVNSMTQYQRYFGLAAASKGTSLVFGIYTVGQVCAFFPSSTLPDWIGRRKTMMLGNFLVIFGAFLTGFAQNKHMFLGGRWITGFGCNIQFTAAKMYMAEITSPSNRGRYIGLLNTWYYIGQLVASGIAIPLGRIAGNYSWRIPIMIQAVPGIINFSCIHFCPESPRWLYAHGQREQAIRVLALFHSRTTTELTSLTRLQIAEIEENIRVDGGADKVWWDFRPVFATRNYRYRFFLTIIAAWWGQIAGNALLTYFLPILLGQAGISNPDRQRVLNFVNGVTSFAAALAGVCTIDHFGRRKLMLFSTAMDSVNMFIIGALLSPLGYHSSTRATAGIVFIYLFAVFFSYGWTPLQAVYVSELFAYEVRTKAIALQAWFISCIVCINTFGLPTALGAIGYKVYLIFGAWNLVGLIFVYIFIVETKRLSLEELDTIFDARNPRDRSLQLQADLKILRQRHSRSQEEA